MANSAERIRAWAEHLKRTRLFFEGEGYLEVSTPCVVPVGAFESVLDPITVSHSQGNAQLRTSPEFALKDYLGIINEPIYELGKSFRDDPLTPAHRKEFTMLEFYAPQQTFRDMIELMQRYLQSLSSVPLPFEIVTVRDLVLTTSQVDLRQAETESDLRLQVEKCGVHLSANETWNDLFFKLLLEKVEPAMDPDTVLIVTEFPTRLCTLCQIDKGGQFTERFEIYWKGMEICNGATELSDIHELQRRYQSESAEIVARGKKPHAYPQHFEEAMTRMPPCAGVAVGMDRLFKCLTGFELV